MRSIRLAGTLVLALLPAAFTNAWAGGLNYTSNVQDGGRTITCDEVEMRFSNNGWRDIVTARRNRNVTLEASPSTPFRADAAERGGVRVQPSSDGTFSASVCMAAGATSLEAGERILDQLEIVNERGGLRVIGPESDNWVAEIILSVPRGMSLDLNAVNGPLGVRYVNGKFTLRTTNGPIQIVGVEGVVDAEAENGPIQFKGHSGDMRLVTQNGPLQISLDDAKWSGKGMVARTQNGPVQLEAPPTLKSGVEIKGSEWSPVKINGSSRSLEVREDGDQYFRLGEGAVVVRLSTVNGPIQISGPRRSKSGSSI